MLETLIITTSNMFNSWRTSVIVISVFVVLGVIAGILIAVFAHKNKARITGLQEDNKNWKHSLSKVELERKQVQDRCNVLEKEKNSVEIDLNYRLKTVQQRLDQESTEHRITKAQLTDKYESIQETKSAVMHEQFQLQNNHSQLQNNHSQLQSEHSQLQNNHSQLQNKCIQLQSEHSQLQSEKGRIQQEFSLERDQLLQSLKTIIPKALIYLRTHTVNVILDADTAHRRLIVSDDGKQVRDGQTEGVERGKDTFDKELGVVGKEGFSSGCFYFEVQVKGQTRWDLGVARASADRRGLICLSPERGYWIVGRRYEKYRARDSPAYSLSPSVDPQRVGVFVDYENGLVSFYDVKSSSHIYTYTNQSFNEKLYPFVGLGYDSNANSTPLIICDD